MQRVELPLSQVWISGKYGFGLRLDDVGHTPHAGVFVESKIPVPSPVIMVEALQGPSEQRQGIGPLRAIL